MHCLLLIATPERNSLYIETGPLHQMNTEDESTECLFSVKIYYLALFLAILMFVRQKTDLRARKSGFKIFPPVGLHSWRPYQKGAAATVSKWVAVQRRLVDPREKWWWHKHFSCKIGHWRQHLRSVFFYRFKLINGQFPARVVLLLLQRTTLSLPPMFCFYSMSL